MKTEPGTGGLNSPLALRGAMSDATANAPPAQGFSVLKPDLAGLGAGIGFILCGFSTYAFPWYAGLTGWPSTLLHGIAYVTWFLGAAAALGGLGEMKGHVRDALVAVLGVAVFAGILYGLHRFAAGLDGWPRILVLVSLLLVLNWGIILACVLGSGLLERALRRSAEKQSREPLPKRVAAGLIAAVGVLTPLVEFLPKGVEAARAILGT